MNDKAFGSVQRSHNKYAIKNKMQCIEQKLVNNLEEAKGPSILDQ